MLSQIFRIALIKKFAASLREEGIGMAMRKTRAYLGIVLGGAGRSALFFSGRGSVNNDHLYLKGTWQTLARRHAFHVSQAPALISGRRKIALIADMNLPQCRKYRVEQLVEFWADQNVEVAISHYGDVPRSVNVMQDATHVIEYRLQTTPVTAMYRYEARRLRLPILYDIDDPLFSIAAYETYQNMEAVGDSLKAHFLSEAPRYLEMMNGADIVSVSTPAMAEHTRLLCPRAVHVRRNFADSATLAAGQRAMQAAPDPSVADGLFWLAFASGSQGHEVDFAVIQDQVITFLDGAADRRLMILGHFDKTLLPEALRDRVEMHAFSDYDTYLSQLARADCAIMPLADDLFNSCKSAVRVLDASAVGVPSIVGTVSDMAQVVSHDKTGIVAQQPSDWAAALDAFAADRSGTRQMGQAARAELESRWSGRAEAHIISPEIIEWVKQ